MKHLHLSICSIIFFSHPLLITFLAPVVLGEQFKIKDASLCILGFSGIVVMGLDQSSGEGSDDKIYGLMLATLSCLFPVLGIMALRRAMVVERVHWSTGSFYIGLCSTLTSTIGPFLFYAYYHFSLYDKVNLTWMALSGLSACLLFSAQSYSFKQAPASFLAPFGFLTVIFTFLSDLLIFRETFIYLDFIGALIIGGSVMMQIIG